jgi:hypothetical protein
MQFNFYNTCNRLDDYNDSDSSSDESEEYYDLSNIKKYKTMINLGKP